MSKFGKILCLALIFCVFGGALTWSKDPKPAHGQLQKCTDKTLGVKFFCNPEWGLETENNMMLIVIADDPAVTLAVAKSNAKNVLIEQLTPKHLQQMGQYADGFSNEFVKVAGEHGVRVDGVSRVYPDIRLMDFYVIHKGGLYSILCAVDPKARWPEYETLFKKIVDSFEFLPEAANEASNPSPT